MMKSPSSDTLHGKLVLEARVERLAQAIDREQDHRRDLVDHVHSLEARLIALENGADDAS